MDRILTGLDCLREESWERFKGMRLGLLSNQASLDGNLVHAKDIISRRLPGQLKALFGPQHGYTGEDQDNMIETDHAIDTELKIPLYSLYSRERSPLPEMLDLIDVLIIDMQDVGTRVYTFASTMLNCIRAATKSDKKVVVLDRPNPLGGDIVEGNRLRPEFYSFVGAYKIPMRHGLTMGELAGIFNDVFKIHADLEIIPMKGWRREMLWNDTCLRWIMPSPNMPFPETAHVYPGQVIWEGTNISEGRGTCRPFEMFGAPYLDTKMIRLGLMEEAIKGCHLQTVAFRPTFNKWQGELCHGFMIHILDNGTFCPYFTSIALLKTIIETHKEDFLWKPPPYEYEYEKLPIDMILGDSRLRKEIEAGGDLAGIKAEWVVEQKEFMEWRQPYLLY